ncbi:MAG: hypothetical protein FJ318_00935 [SAR202 cluster bacterium]|nr:hypothetical protein [SAR202 cluster bacterium]
MEALPIPHLPPSREHRSEGRAFIALYREQSSSESEFVSQAIDLAWIVHRPDEGTYPSTDDYEWLANHIFQLEEHASRRQPDEKPSPERLLANAHLACVIGQCFMHIDYYQPTERCEPAWERVLSGLAILQPEWGGNDLTHELPVNELGAHALAGWAHWALLDLRRYNKDHVGSLEHATAAIRKTMEVWDPAFRYDFSHYEHEAEHPPSFSLPTLVRFTSFMDIDAYGQTVKYRWPIKFIPSLIDWDESTTDPLASNNEPLNAGDMAFSYLWQGYELVEDRALTDEAGGRKVLDFLDAMREANEDDIDPNWQLEIAAAVAKHKSLLSRENIYPYLKEVLNSQEPGPAKRAAEQRLRRYFVNDQMWNLFPQRARDRFIAADDIVFAEEPTPAAMALNCLQTVTEAIFDLFFGSLLSDRALTEHLKTRRSKQPPVRASLPAKATLADWAFLFRTSRFGELLRKKGLTNAKVLQFRDGPLRWLETELLSKRNISEHETDVPSKGVWNIYRTFFVIGREGFLTALFEMHLPSPGSKKGI